MAASYANAVQKVRDHLKEIVGDEYKHVFSDDFIKSELNKFNGRIDAVECALEDLIEIHYAEANEQMNKLIPEDIFSPNPSKPREPVTFFHLPFVKKVNIFLILPARFKICQRSPVILLQEVLFYFTVLVGLFIEKASHPTAFGLPLVRNLS